MADDLTYTERTRVAIENQCKARNIDSKDVPKVMKALEQKWGDKLNKLDPPTLRRMNQQLDVFFFEYLSGQKRA